VSVSLPHPADVHLGFVPLLDAAPLILAAELGYFADEGLQVALHRQIGWGNVRDKLVYGQLHASHALMGMPPVSVLGGGRFPEPVTAVMALGTGGNAITLSRRLTDAGVRNAHSLATSGLVGARPGGGAGGPRPILGHVFSCSTHHYLLRDWLAAGGVDPDRDVRLTVLPPPQMVGQVRAGALDGFCAGEPWNTLAEQSGTGRIVAATAARLPGHPEKVLAVNRRWLARSPEVAVALVRAVLRACAFCHDPSHAGRVAEVLSRPGYMDTPADLLARSLSRKDSGGGGIGATAPSHDPAATFPSATHAAWLLGQMIRWGHLPPGPATDVIAAARASVAGDVYRRAAGAVGIPCPDNDFPPMALPGRATFDPARERPTQPELLTTAR
jgi:ABC-type nitrate/sulfonate/bicarbonate transport system substrate-binding protein